MLKTACHLWHTRRGARIVEFAGWEMPIQYSSIIEEHQAVRRAAGLFDIAHMGRLRFRGRDASRFLDHLLTNNVQTLEVGQIRYALVTNDEGGILDDVLVYRFAESFLLVVNASNRLTILDWIDQCLEGATPSSPAAPQQPGCSAGTFDVTVEDRTEKDFMFALQGPRAMEILNPLVTNRDISQIRYYHSAEVDLGGNVGLLSRTGYTGEDGFEVIVAAEIAAPVWEQLIDRGAKFGLAPAGLGCRDTLRLEAAMPLYGHELDETIDPFTAGLSFAVKLNTGQFIGKEALIAKQADKNRASRIGLKLEGRRIARQGAAVFAGDTQVGQVTSGTFSPTLHQPIAMAYVARNHAQAGTTLQVDVRGKRHAATIVKLPFYKRK